MRRAAIVKVTDATLLERAATTDKDAAVRQAALERVSDAATLAQAALRDKDAAVQTLAAGRLRDQAALTTVARKATMAGARIAALQRLDDAAVVDDIARTDVDASVRKAAAELPLRIVGRLLDGQGRPVSRRGVACVTWPGRELTPEDVPAVFESRLQASTDHEGAFSISLPRDTASTRVLAFAMRSADGMGLHLATAAGGSASVGLRTTVTREIAHSGHRVVTVDQTFSFTLDPKKPPRSSSASRLHSWPTTRAATRPRKRKRWGTLQPSGRGDPLPEERAAQAGRPGLRAGRARSRAARTGGRCGEVGGG